ncbi:MAG: lysylphosphatidylglycerol synthase domain-containing protein [Crocinitomicaceae bacterium]|nr:lysylphosphatidylglycerol synthase domain-containing protein [Crocinitomicaceae bacterium]
MQSINLYLKKPFYLILVVLLMPINWYLEWQKWIFILKENRMQNDKALDSFTAGMVSGFFTPGFPGNFLGRVFYFKKKRRIRLTTYIQIGNFSQLITSIIFGFIAFFVLWKTTEIFPLKSIYQSTTALFLTLVSLAIIVVFLKKRNFKTHFFLKHKININSILEFFKKALVLSILRHLVFSTQFFFALLCFNIPASTELFLWIWITYFAVTLTPSLFFGKMIIRDSIAVAIFSIGGYEALPVLLSSFSIWTINVFMPTLIAWKKTKPPNV